MCRFEELGCDFFMAGCHKWLFGPRGTGIIWASDRAWAAVSPIIPTFMDDEVRNAWMRGDEPPDRTTGRRMTPGGFKAFEHQWAMAEAFKFHLDIGQTSDEQALARYRYMLQTAPPETIEQAHAEAFERLTPEQRRMVLEEVNANVPQTERAQANDDPQSLAHLATRAEIREPGAGIDTYRLERAIGAGLCLSPRASTQP